MSCCSSSIRSGCAVRNFSSSSVAVPRNRRSFSTASCHWGGGTGYRGLGYFSTRSVGGVGFSRRRAAVGRSPPLRRGYGFGAASTGFGYRGAGFGYRVGGVSRLCTITPITVNERLLQPLKLELDPNVQTVKNQEKEQIKTLNNKFASFIDQVRLLEQQNKVLETKWSFLQGQEHRKDTIPPALEACVGNLKKKLEALGCNRAQLETALREAQWALETNKKMYEDERSQRTCAEGELIALKKDADCFFLNKAELRAKVESLRDEAEFLRVLHAEQTHQLRAQMADTLVVVQTDNGRDLDLGGIPGDVRAQYEDVARRSRAEARAWYENKFEELRATAGRNTDILRETKTEIAELRRSIQRRSRDIGSAKDQRHKLEAAVASAERRGETAVKDAKHKLAELEAALQRTKAELARQLRENQELMDVKLALGMEIVTYRKLLEGEESRLCAEEGFAINTPARHSQGGLADSPEPSFTSTHTSAKRSRCRTSSAGICGGDGVGSRSTRSSHTMVVPVTKSARSNV